MEEIRVFSVAVESTWSDSGRQNGGSAYEVGTRVFILGEYGEVTWKSTDGAPEDKEGADYQLTYLQMEKGSWAEFLSRWPKDSSERRWACLPPASSRLPSEVHVG